MMKTAYAVLMLVCVAFVSSARAQAPGSTGGDIIKTVRAQIAANDFAGGERALDAYRANRNGVWTPEALEALSWLGRGALAKKDFAAAERYARQTQELSEAALAGRGLDDEKNLPIALGAAFEVQAHVRAEQGSRTEAVRGLQLALETYKHTSIRTRIQKNINLLSLEGKVAPAYEVTEWVGADKPTLASLRGHPVVLFFWAHWCPDCKAMAASLAALEHKYASQGLRLVAPTQLYGYVAGGKRVGAAEELAHIAQVRQTSYGAIKDMPIPVGEETFKVYGSSTTPTLVLVDRDGVVKLYKPGGLPLDELDKLVRSLVAAQPSAAQQ